MPMKIWSVRASVLSFEISYRLVSYRREVWIKTQNLYKKLLVVLVKCSSGGDLDMKSFKDPGWCSKLVLLPLRHCQKQDGSLLGCPHGTGFVKSVCKGTALPSGRGNFHLWLFVICIIFFSALTAWAHCGVPVSGINEAVFIIYVLMMYHSPISHFPKCRFKAVCCSFM